jgi:hypothetical protein
VRLIVGIGASAGGLEAFKGFLAKMPPDSGMAFVLIQHLNPDHRSLLPELIARETPMPVREIEDGMEVEPNAVFVMPPNATLTLQEGRFGLERPAPPRSLRYPIDAFFNSSDESSTWARPSSCKRSCSTSSSCPRRSGSRPATPPTPTRSPISTSRPSTPSSSYCSGTVRWPG